MNKVLANLFLGFSSGLPLLLIGSTLQAWFTVSGASLAVIALLSLVGQPYVYKFLWAPILDCVTPPFLGRRRGWIAIMQFFLFLCLLLIAWMNPTQSPGWVAVLALVIAFFSASQDVAIDAYRADLLNAKERGMGAAMTNIGYRVAMLVAGGIALALAEQIGWRFTYLLMAGLMLLGLWVTFKVPAPKDDYKPSSLLAAVVEPLKNFLSRPAAGWLVLFIIFYHLSSSFNLSLSTAFLLRGLEFSLAEVGLFYKTIGLIAVLGGSFLGGILLPRFNLYRSLLGFGLLQGFASLSYMGLAMIGKNYPLAMLSVFMDNFFTGLAQVAFIVFLMSLCDKRYTATQYALFSAIAAVGRVYVGPLAAVLIDHLNWVGFFFCSFLLAFPGIFLLMFIKKHIIVQQSAETDQCIVEEEQEACA